jgi:hypothetical protein
MSDLDLGFENEGRWGIMVGIEDAPHIGPEERKRLGSAYAPARLLGQPSLGSGAVFPIAETEYVVRPFELPNWFRHCCAIDFGWRTTACIWLAHDVEADVAYAYAEYVRSEAEPPIHVAAIKARGAWVPAIADPAGRQRSQADGAQLFELYRRHGLNLQPAVNAVEAGILEIWTRLSTNKLKIFSTLQHLLGEMRIYHRGEDGKIVKAHDHCVDGLRYATVSGLPIAQPKPQTQWSNGKPNHTYDYDPMKSLWQRPR